MSIVMCVLYGIGCAEQPPPHSTQAPSQLSTQESSQPSPESTQSQQLDSTTTLPTSFFTKQNNLSISFSSSSLDTTTGQILILPSPVHRLRFTRCSQIRHSLNTYLPETDTHPNVPAIQSSSQKSFAVVPADLCRPNSLITPLEIITTYQSTRNGCIGIPPSSGTLRIFNILWRSYTKQKPCSIKSHDDIDVNQIMGYYLLYPESSFLLTNQSVDHMTSSCHPKLKSCLKHTQNPIHSVWSHSSHHPYPQKLPPPSSSSSTRDSACVLDTDTSHHPCITRYIYMNKVSTISTIPAPIPRVQIPLGKPMFTPSTISKVSGLHDYLLPITNSNPSISNETIKTDYEADDEDICIDHRGLVKHRTQSTVSFHWQVQRRVVVDTDTDTDDDGDDRDRDKRDGGDHSLGAQSKWDWMESVPVSPVPSTFFSYAWSGLSPLSSPTSSLSSGESISSVSSRGSDVQGISDTVHPITPVSMPMSTVSSTSNLVKNDCDVKTKSNVSKRSKPILPRIITNLTTLQSHHQQISSPSSQQSPPQQQQISSSSPQQVSQQQPLTLPLPPSILKLTPSTLIIPSRHTLPTDLILQMLRDTVSEGEKVVVFEMPVDVGVRGRHDSGVEQDTEKEFGQVDQEVSSDIDDGVDDQVKQKEEISEPEQNVQLQDQHQYDQHQYDQEQPNQHSDHVPDIHSTTTTITPHRSLIPVSRFYTIASSQTVLDALTWSTSSDYTNILNDDVVETIVMSDDVVKPSQFDYTDFDYEYNDFDVTDTSSTNKSIISSTLHGICDVVSMIRDVVDTVHDVSRFALELYTISYLL